MEMIAFGVTPESGLVLEGIMMIPTRVEKGFLLPDKGDRHIKAMGYILAQ